MKTTEPTLFFRITFLSLWVCLGIVRGYYGRKTKTHDSLVGVKEKLKTAELEMGTGGKVIAAISTVIGVVGLIQFLLALPWGTWTYPPLSEWIQWTGVVLAILPLFYLIWVHQHLDTQWSIALEIQEEHKLITTGPYRRVRHPMYLGIFVYTIGLCLISLNILVIQFFVYSILVNYRRIPSEEQMMIDQFGEEYVEYMKRTGKLLPAF